MRCFSNCVLFGNPQLNRYKIHKISIKFKIKVEKFWIAAAACGRFMGMELLQGLDCLSAHRQNRKVYHIQFHIDRKQSLEGRTKLKQPSTIPNQWWQEQCWYSFLNFSFDLLGSNVKKVFQYFDWLNQTEFEFQRLVVIYIFEAQKCDGIFVYQMCHEMKISKEIF